MLSQTFVLCVHLDKLKLEKAVLPKIPVTLNFKLKNLFEFLTGKLVSDSDLEAHQAFSDAKSATVFLKCDSLCSNRNHEINTIDSRLIRQNYLSWG